MFSTFGRWAMGERLEEVAKELSEPSGLERECKGKEENLWARGMYRERHQSSAGGKLKSHQLWRLEVTGGFKQKVLLEGQRWSSKGNGEGWRRWARTGKCIPPRKSTVKKIEKATIYRWGGWFLLLLFLIHEGLRDIFIGTHTYIKSHPGSFV